MLEACQVRKKIAIFRFDAKGLFLTLNTLVYCFLPVNWMRQVPY